MFVTVTKLAGLARASPCSSSTPTPVNTACTVSVSLAVSAGTLGMQASPNLHWTIDASGYDQWASASATSLSSCSLSGSATSCSGGSKPLLEVIDATGTGGGWSVSVYETSNALPSGSVLTFDGAGSSTIGHSTVAPIGSDPFSGATPSTVCDQGSSCAVASPASGCSHQAIGFTSCPSYPVTISGTSSSAQTDLYSAAAGSGEGAICFASGTATGSGCAGTALDAYYNLGVKQNAAAAAFESVTLNMSVNSGP